MMKKVLNCVSILVMCSVMFTTLTALGQGIVSNPVQKLTPDSVVLKGAKDFGGTNSDQGKTYYYNQNLGSNYRFICRVNSHTGAGIRGKVIAFLKDVNTLNENDGNRPMYFISAEIGQIAFYSRPQLNQRTRKLASIATSGYPCWLSIEKKADSLIARWSVSPANTPINNISWSTLAKYGNAFVGWANIRRGLGVASGTNNYSTANISKFSIEPTGGSVVAPIQIQGISDGQVIASWNAYGATRVVKARIFAGKLWVTDASLVTDNYFFVRGGNFLSRSDVTLANNFSNTKIQFFEGITSFNGVAAPTNFEVPAGFQLGTNTQISNDGIPYYEPIQSLPSCIGVFSILSATQQSGQFRGEYIFNAQNAIRHRWNLFLGSVLVASDTITATSSQIVFNIPNTVNSGTYILKVDIQNCTATDSRTFIYAKPGGGLVSAPVISSNPNPAIAGISTTFTASGCGGTTKWFVSDAQVGTGTSLIVANPILGNSYFANCTVNSIASLPSNYITILPTIVNNPVSSVTITEPNKPPYFYSNGQTPGFYANRANLPAVITNTATFEEADVVKLKNADIEVWFNLKRGGQICYASKPNTPINRVYNGYDGGFQWVFDGAQYLVGGNLNGQVSISPQNNVNYNTTMGGDAENNSQTLIDYHAIPNGYYFKFRPILYNFRATVSETELEVTYTLVGKSIKVEYKYISFRTDGNVERNNPFRFMGFHVPICFLTNNFTKYAIYTGSQPWTNGAMSEGDIPNITGGAAPSFGANSTEFMGISYDPVSNFAVGVLNNSDGGSMANITWEQLNKWSGGSAGTVFSGPYTTMAISSSPAIPDGSNYQKTWTSYLTLGDSKEAVRAELRTRAGQ